MCFRFKATKRGEKGEIDREKGMDKGGGEDRKERKGGKRKGGGTGRKWGGQREGRKEVGLKAADKQLIMTPSPLSSGGLKAESASRVWSSPVCVCVCTHESLCSSTTRWQHALTF